MALSGTTGFVRVAGLAKSGDKWTADLDQAAVDRANFTTAGEPLNAAGQRTGTISFDGPYEGTLGVVRGTVYVFTLGLTPALFVTVSGRITKVSISNDCKDGPRFSIAAQQYGAATVNL